jgi:hypothetical protein
VCAGDGNQDSLYNATGFTNAIGKTMVFPITDGQIVLAGQSVDKFNVVGYASLRLDGVFDSNQTGFQNNVACPPLGSIGPANYTAGSTTDLVAMANSAGCSPFNIVQSVTAANGTGCCQAGNNKDYQLVTNPATGGVTGITWLKDVVNVSINMTVQKNGVCGPPQGTAGHCIAVSWQGAQLGNGPLGGNNVGVPAVRLCDPAITGSCDTLS